MSQAQRALTFVTVSFSMLATIAFLSSENATNTVFLKVPELQRENATLLEVRRVEAIFAAHRKCIQVILGEANAETIWNRSCEVVNECAINVTHLYQRLRMVPFQNNDEIKLVLDVFPKIKREEECNVVTLGIGMDIKAELELKRNLSTSCHFHGADPGETDNKELYSKIGTFYPYAISAESGVQRASLYDPKSGSYYFTNITHLDIVTFLKDKAKVKIIDYLWMDNEYAEYDLVNLFLPGELLDQNGITVCQWNCEFHVDGNKSKYADFFLKNLESGRFVPIGFVRGYHVRAVFINVQDEICLQRYIRPQTHNDAR